MKLLLLLTTIVTLIATPSGISDKSFNQSAWEGIEDFEGANHLDTQDDSDYVTAFGIAVQGGSDIIVANGFNQVEAVEEFREHDKDTQFITVDFVREEDNTISITFDDYQAAFLCGVVAGHNTKTDHVAFLGGGKNAITEMFEDGFRDGVAWVDKDIEVTGDYIGNFTDAGKAKQMSQTLYNEGVDIIYSVAGNAGLGVFSEAKDIVSNDSSQEIYVIGVDMDQDEEGLVMVDGNERSLTLTSSLKQIGTAVRNELEKIDATGFESGHKVYGLEDEGVGITTERLDDETLELVEKATEHLKNVE